MWNGEWGMGNARGPDHACDSPFQIPHSPFFRPRRFLRHAPHLGRKNHWRISRIVTLPDFQGIGIGMRFMEAIADLHIADGHRLNVTASHPALIAHCRRSPNWRAIGIKKTGSHHTERFIASYHGSAGRAVVSFECTPQRVISDVLNMETQNAVAFPSGSALTPCVRISKDSKDAT
jgi:GNAT superfamily N-acetyltransferase